MPEDVFAHDARFAHQEQPDVSVQQIAAVYAEALLGATEKAGQTEVVLAELDQLVSEVLDRIPKFAAVLGSAWISHEEKVGMLDRVLGGRVSPLLLNFLKVLSRRGRLDCLAAIRREAHRVWDRLRNRVPVQVTTATPLAPPLAQRLTQRLRSLVGGEPVIEYRVDPAVIGGLVVRVGDTLFDASVVTQLQSLRKQILDRSAYEIQSRRDRFRHPAGN